MEDDSTGGWGTGGGGTLVQRVTTCAVSTMVALTTTCGPWAGFGDVDLSCDRGKRFALVASAAPGRLCIECAELEPEEGESRLQGKNFGGARGSGGIGARQFSTTRPLVVRAAWLELRYAYINAWFGTTYGV